MQNWAMMFRALRTFVASLLRKEREGKEPERAEYDWLGRFRASGDAASCTANRPLSCRCVTVIAREPVPAIAVTIDARATAIAPSRLRQNPRRLHRVSETAGRNADRASHPSECARCDGGSGAARAQPAGLFELSHGRCGVCGSPRLPRLSSKRPVGCARAAPLPPSHRAHSEG